MINKELSEILNADKKARERIYSTAELSEKMQKKLAEDNEMLNQKYADEAAKTIEENKQKQEAILNKAKNSYNERFEKTEAALNALYENKKNAWISEIVRSVTEVDKK